MHFCDGFIVNRQQSGWHVAERGRSSSAYETGQGVDVAAFGDDLVYNVEPGVVCEVFCCAFGVRTILPVSGVVVLYYSL